MIDSALEGIKSPKINVFVDGSELEGWELRAACDDLKLGLKHGVSLIKSQFLAIKNGKNIWLKLGPGLSLVK